MKKLSIIFFLTVLCISSAFAASDVGKKDGLFGAFIFGPKISLGTIPPIAGLGLDAKITPLFGLGLDYQYVPTLNLGEVSIKFNSTTASFRIFPFMGSMFLGLTYGTFNGVLEKSGTILTQSISASLEVKTMILAPNIGWRWVWNSGFFMGMKLGYQFPVSVKSTLSASTSIAEILATPEYLKMKSDIESAANTYGKMALPHFSLLELGFYF